MAGSIRRAAEACFPGIHLSIAALYADSPALIGAGIGVRCIAIITFLAQIQDAIAAYFQPAERAAAIARARHAGCSVRTQRCSVRTIHDCAILTHTLFSIVALLATIHDSIATFGTRPANISALLREAAETVTAITIIRAGGGIAEIVAGCITACVVRNGVAAMRDFAIDVVITYFI